MNREKVIAEARKALDNGQVNHSFISDEEILDFVELANCARESTYGINRKDNINKES